MWAIQYGRGHLDPNKFKTRRAAILSWIRRFDAAYDKADDGAVFRHWTAVRRASNAKTVRVT